MDQRSSTVASPPNTPLVLRWAGDEAQLLLLRGQAAPSHLWKPTTQPQLWGCSC